MANRSRLLVAIMVAATALGWLVSLSCAAVRAGYADKASPTLLVQIELRRKQMSAPTQERQQQMTAMGMRTDNPGVQRVFIYLYQPLTPAQADELRALSITLYPDSWIPPTGNHPAGFMLADMPVDKLEALAAKDFVIRLDTAETRLEPQGRKDQ